MEGKEPAAPTRRAMLRGAIPCALALPALGCAMADPVPLAGIGPVPQGNIPLCLVSRDWHTEIGLPLRLLDAPAAEDWRGVVPQDGQVGFGFGAKAFMMAPSPGMSEALAALLNAPGVVAVSGMSARPADDGQVDDYVELKVTQAGLGRMLHFVRQQVERDAAGRPALVDGGPFRGRSLFDSRLRYSSHFTCNTWTLQALGAAGLPVQSGEVVWSRQVMRQAHRIAAAQAAG